MCDEDVSLEWSAYWFRDGTIVTEFGAASGGVSVFKAPEDVTVLANGQIAVTDILNHQIVLF